MDSIHETTRVTRATMKFSGIELRLLATLASDQLFRREFIDPRLPGYKSNPTELSLGKKLVERLRFTADRAERIPSIRRNGASL
jgi:hypothetical protein